MNQVLVPLQPEAAAYDELLDFIGNARFVLIGAASCGTHEFVSERARITRRLIAEKGFAAVAVAADGPDAYRVDAYVKGASDAPGAAAALSGFRRFPAWPYRNAEIAEFLEWLRTFNSRLSRQERVGFYGLDLYSRSASIETILNYLDRVDPAAAGRARYRFATFDHFREDPLARGYAPSFGLSRSAEDEAVEQLRDLQRNGLEHAQALGRLPEDDRFYSEQNIRLARTAEQYYRAMFGSRVAAWNLRDQHMMDTLDHLVVHLRSRAGPPRLVLWENNANAGDARVTDLARSGEVTMGQLVRQRWGREAVNIGLTMHHGAVISADHWGAPARQEQVLPASRGSYEDLFHQLDMRDFMLFTPTAEAVLPARRMERSIGVVYRPETEQVSHYFEASLARQFDAVLHFDETHALQPLDPLRPGEGESPHPERGSSGR